MYEAIPLQAGVRVRVTQQMPQVEKVWTTSVEGTILRWRQAKTGSWFAHSQGDRLWLDRLELKRDDGEVVVLNLDHYSVIEPAPLASSPN
jgi:hypothetical protein